MRSDHRAPGELQKCVLQRAKGLDVKIVGGFVEQEQVATHLQGEREIQPVALTTGEHLRRFLLIRAFETEGGDIGA